MKKILKNALLGTAVNIGGTYSISYIASISYAVFLASHNVGYREIYQSLYSVGFLTFLLLVSVLLDILGGYIAAALNSERHVLVGMLSALPCLFIGVFSLLSPLPNPTPIWFILISWLVVIPAAMIGGYLAKRLHTVTETPVGA
ncbi:hypothetical protein [Paludibacterium paludis]|uniref:Uncharacterized protein n=1 Tax=Paludibacterium paludis TaxID=1225769 RepID=A0A918P242_9NEIS|nr:hypothetical protein [Paludibacterium paludis]GGY13698.1 hypothetical protein GCM10011289_16290 [Paludibacterium paludis]